LLIATAACAPFPNRYRHKKDIARHVARNLYSGNAALFRIGINYDAPFRITFTAKALR
jgi:hypothetical protein